MYRREGAGCLSRRQVEKKGCAPTGIGLTIVRRAAERMGGQVGFDSEPGKGSTFWVQLSRAD